MVPDQRSAETETSLKGTQGRAPDAVVLFNGRIAYPHLTLTTWGLCPFIIERVQRRDRSTLIVFGRDAQFGCEAAETRHRVTKRLTRLNAGGGENVDQVTVVSRDPEYRVEAHMTPVLA